MRNQPLYCAAEDTSPKLWLFDPSDLGEDMKVVMHIQCSREVDAKTKQHVQDTAKENTWWPAWEKNCKDYANSLTYYVLGAKLREQIENQKKANEESKAKQ